MKPNKKSGLCLTIPIDFREDIRFKKLCMLSGKSAIEVSGLLLLLWEWALRYSDDGFLGNDICDCMISDNQLDVSAFKALESSNYIHVIYNGRFVVDFNVVASAVKNREKSTLRKKRQRIKLITTSVLSRDSHGTVTGQSRDSHGTFNNKTPYSTTESIKFSIPNESSNDINVVDQNTKKINELNSNSDQLTIFEDTTPDSIDSKVVFLDCEYPANSSGRDVHKFKIKVSPTNVYNKYNIYLKDIIRNIDLSIFRVISVVYTKEVFSSMENKKKVFPPGEGFADFRKTEPGVVGKKEIGLGDKGGVGGKEEKGRGKKPRGDNSKEKQNHADKSRSIFTLTGINAVSDSREEPEKNSIDSISKTKNDPEKVFLIYPCEGEQTWVLNYGKLRELKTTYPNLIIMDECRKAYQWVLDNPPKRKTPRGMNRFLGTWMSRADDKRKVLEATASNKKFYTGHDQCYGLTGNEEDVPLTEDQYRYALEVLDTIQKEEEMKKANATPG